MQLLAIWQPTAAEPLLLASSVAWFDASGGVSLGPSVRPAAAIVPARRGAAIGLVFVPEIGTVERNGCRSPSGASALHHGDRLTVAGREWFVSSDVEPVAFAYDPAIHGEDQFCLRTKARLVVGEPVVACPGTGRAACGLLYTAAAWRLGLRCHACGRDPKARRWRPPVPPRGGLASLVARFVAPVEVDRVR